MAGLTPEDNIVGNKNEPNDKSSPEADISSSPLCPKCKSKRVWRDAKRYTPVGFEIQRWYCRDCGLRFSDPNDLERAKKSAKAVETVDTKSLKTADNIVTTRQICVTETKNLVAEQQKLEIPRRTEVDLKGAIVEFLWQLKRQNFAEDTITTYGYSLEVLLQLGINLFDPQNFIDVMANLSDKTNIRKYNLTKAYRCFLNQHDINAKLPKYKVTRPMPYIPPEEYLDQLIACCNQQMAAFLQTLKETAARPGEAWKLEWDDLDLESKKLHISHPEKGCNPRIRPISPKLLRMLLALPRTQKRIFTYKSKGVAGKSFRTMRKRAIQKLGNPELRKIDFYTCRYWKATQEYRRTHDFGCVMVLLGHKSLRYVLLYAQLSEAYDTDKGYICKEAANRHEAKQLIEAGFEYVVDKEGVSLFRKVK